MPFAADWMGSGTGSWHITRVEVPVRGGCVSRTRRPRPWSRTQQSWSVAVCVFKLCVSIMMCVFEVGVLHCIAFDGVELWPCASLTTIQVGVRYLCGCVHDVFGADR